MRVDLQSGWPLFSRASSSRPATPSSLVLERKPDSIQICRPAGRLSYRCLKGIEPESGQADFSDPATRRLLASGLNSSFVMGRQGLALGRRYSQIPLCLPFLPDENFCGGLYRR